MQEEVTQKNDCPVCQSGKRRGEADRTGVAESNQEVFGTERQSPAWETDHAAAYEAERGRSNIEITDSNIKAFESTAKKYKHRFFAEKG